MRKFRIVLFFSFFCHVVFSQIKTTDELYKTSKKLDSLLFDIGFNQCDLSHYDSIVSDDLEFYHDKGGITLGKEAFTASIKNNICGGPNKVKRELVPNSMKVFPMYKNNVLYSFIQEGEHDFYEFYNEKWNKGSRAKFTVLWLLENKQWKMKRVFSYDHH
ncbi:nuclear transport factor 2 family protein [Chryseobacterium nematophagum]|uniref:Nuclear transport factor 2 family protein n=1 Tax=Chryseobacterium nematophagum TaxID=2305228 RepID=A0A3M7TFD6_9FLAO|nr:nuclear transport factor 2 family protein [Chryseobacterium nematophagum]RNA61804.1 nuclear transport factor 2 family protein [Chryseobacterium nematophagum]